MKKVYELEDLCYANCAAKIASKIKKLDGVNAVSVNFLMQKFTLDVEDDKFDDIFMQSVKIFKAVEPDCTIIA